MSPVYQKTPLKQSPVLLVAGTIAYLLGSYDDRSSPTFGYIISDSSVTTTATVTFQVVSGPVPIVGDNIAVVGAGRSANLNTTGTVLTVSAVADAAGIQNGVVTVTYTVSSTSLGTASDGGQVTCTRVEVGETLVNGASVPAAVSFLSSNTQQGRTLTVFATVSGAPSTGTVVLQGANFDLDSEYVTLIPTSGGATTASTGFIYDASQANKGGFASYGDDVANYRFYRFTVASVTGGTAPLIYASIEV